MKNIAAFFDVDGTIFRDSLLIEHFKMLIKYKFLKYDLWSSSIEDEYNKWTTRHGDYEGYLEPLTEEYRKGLINIKPEDSEFIAKRVIDLKGDKIYKYSKDRIEYHKKMGHKIVLISGSPDFLVSKMAKKLNLEYYFATEYIIEENKYTGEVVPMWDSESKQKAIDKFVQENSIDLSKSYAYGDTTGDLSMFKKVGNPIAINPAKRLLKLITDSEEIKNKIKIKVERKNVIYSLDIKCIDYNKED